MLFSGGYVPLTMCIELNKIILIPNNLNSGENVSVDTVIEI